MQKPSVSTGFAEHLSKNTPIVLFDNQLLRNGFLYGCVHVRFRGNRFTVPLSSNELFQLSGVISQYLFNDCLRLYRFWAQWGEEKVTPLQKPN
jgi:hypothetical protein